MGGGPRHPGARPVSEDTNQRPGDVVLEPGRQKVAWTRVVVHKPVEMGTLATEGAIRVRERPDGLSPAGERGGHRSAELAKALGYHRRLEGALAWKVLVQRRRLDVELGRNPAHGDRGRALAREKLFRRLHGRGLRGPGARSAHDTRAPASARCLTTSFILRNPRSAPASVPLSRGTSTPSKLSDSFSTVAFPSLRSSNR